MQVDVLNDMLRYSNSTLKQFDVQIDAVNA